MLEARLEQVQGNAVNHMRIIAGKARGTRLVAPKGLDVRPTLDRVREALFSILSPHIEGCAFLDLFAGTGANGIEALSRGATTCTFVDNDLRSIAAITRNLEAAHLAQLAEIRRANLPQDIASLAGKQYGIVFCDPPYKFDEHSILLNEINRAHLLVHEGIVVIEHASRTDIIDNVLPLKRFRLSIYGDTALSFFS